MRVYISADMEGVSGLTDPDDMRPGGGGYEMGRVFMTSEVNATVRGAFAGGASSVLVNDAHSNARNLRMDLIDPRCRVIRGKNRPLRMGQGLEAGADAAILIGYHARAGSAACGVLSHTWMGREITDVYLDGRVVGEIEIVAALAAHYRVPVVLVCGDEAACDEAQAALGKDLAVVAVKAGINRSSANLIPPAKAQELIEAAAEQTVRTAVSAPVQEAPGPVVLEVVWNNPEIAATATLLPGIQACRGELGIRYEARDMPEAIGVLGVLAMLAAHLTSGAGPYG